MFLLCAFLLMRHRHVTVRHVYWRHPRFHHALYWLSGFAFCELALWWLAAELLGLWWLAWLGARGVTAATERRRDISRQWTAMLAAARPAWPRVRLSPGALLAAFLVERRPQKWARLNSARSGRMG